MLNTFWSDVLLLSRTGKACVFGIRECNKGAGKQSTLPCYKDFIVCRTRSTATTETAHDADVGPTA